MGRFQKITVTPLGAFDKDDQRLVAPDPIEGEDLMKLMIRYNKPPTLAEVFRRFSAEQECIVEWKDAQSKNPTIVTIYIGGRQVKEEMYLKIFLNGWIESDRVEYDDDDQVTEWMILTEAGKKEARRRKIPLVENMKSENTLIAASF